MLQRILTRGHPLTEDAVFLSLLNILWQRGSRVYQKVQRSKDTGGYRYFTFSPDIDLLEIRHDGVVVGYELKGERRGAKGIQPPMFYDGLDQALAYLINPVGSPCASTFTGSIFDFVYLVHPANSDVPRLSDLLERLTPVGLVIVDRKGTKEVVKPKPKSTEGMTMQQRNGR